MADIRERAQETEADLIDQNSLQTESAQAAYNARRSRLVALAHLLNSFPASSPLSYMIC